MTDWRALADALTTLEEGAANQHSANKISTSHRNLGTAMKVKVMADHFVKVPAIIKHCIQNLEDNADAEATQQGFSLWRRLSRSPP